MTADFLQLLQTALERPSRTEAEWDAWPAAVLIPLYEAPPGVWHVVFTLRTEDLGFHKGQVSFPGGRADPGDPDPAATALREAEEEIGLKPEAVTVMGQLDELLTVTQYRITPVVGVIAWPFPFAPSIHEVAEVFSVPLDWLADPANLDIQYRTPPIGVRQIPVYYFREFEGKVIWGATARIVLDLLTRLGLK